MLHESRAEDRRPDLYPADRASVSHAYAVCLHAQYLSGLTINAKVAVIGAGPIGLGQLMLAKASRADVLSIDPVPHARALAEELGADQVAAPKEGAPEAAILAMDRRSRCRHRVRMLERRDHVADAAARDTIGATRREGHHRRRVR